MTETFKQMLERHQSEIAEFRKKCKHAKTEMREYFWAPGHGGGLAKCCKRCGVVIESAHQQNTTIDYKPKIGEYAFFTQEEFSNEIEKIKVRTASPLTDPYYMGDNV